MTAILALVLKFAPYLVQAAQSVPQLVSFIAELRAIFARDKVWTPEQEAEFDQSVQDLRFDTAWTPEDEKP